MYRLTRVRCANGEALLIERSVLPPEVGALVAGIDLERCSIYAELTSQGIIVASARRVIDALVASAEDARLLGVPAGTPLLRVRRRAFSPGADVLEWSSDRYLATCVTFALENSSADAGVVRHLEGAGSA